MILYMYRGRSIMYEYTGLLAYSALIMSKAAMIRSVRRDSLALFSYPSILTMIYPAAVYRSI